MLQLTAILIEVTLHLKITDLQLQPPPPTMPKEEPFLTALRRMLVDKMAKVIHTSTRVVDTLMLVVNAKVTTTGIIISTLYVIALITKVILITITAMAPILTAVVEDIFIEGVMTLAIMDTITAHIMIVKSLNVILFNNVPAFSILAGILLFFLRLMIAYHY